MRVVTLTDLIVPVETLLVHFWSPLWKMIKQKKLLILIRYFILLLQTEDESSSDDEILKSPEAVSDDTFVVSEPVHVRFAPASIPSIASIIPATVTKSTVNETFTRPLTSPRRIGRIMPLNSTKKTSMKGELLVLSTSIHLFFQHFGKYSCLFWCRYAGSHLHVWVKKGQLNMNLKVCLWFSLPHF